jgi:SAGA-associated factor 29
MTFVHSAEVQLWGNTKQSLSSLAAIYQNQSSNDTVGRVNRLISSWPVDDQLPAEGVDAIVTLHKKLSSGLEEISKSANRESESVIPFL